MKKFYITFVAVLVGILVISACSNSQTPAPPPTNTPVPATPAAEDAASEESVAQEPTEEPEAVIKAEAPVEAEVAESNEQPADAETAEETVPEDPTEATAEIRTFVIMPEQSKASYIVAEEFFDGALGRLGIQPGLADTIGNTQEVSGEMQLNLADLSNPVVSSQFVVNIQSLTSDQSRRDNQIRERFLQSNIYPLAEFTISSLENVPASYTEGEEMTFQANGDITIREVTLPTTFDVTAKIEGDTITGVVSTQLTMTDFGFDPPNFANLFSVADDFTAQVEFTFKEQQ